MPLGMGSFAKVWVFSIFPFFLFFLFLLSLLLLLSFENVSHNL